MKPLCLSELVEPLEGVLIGADAQFSSVCTDSRSVQAGDLFVALCGERYDGHAFLAEVANDGAGAALVSRDTDISLPALRVGDTQLALGKLAALNRQYFSGELVAITGSSGKTSVKNMLAEILSCRGPTLATAGNFNNEVGMPLTLLQLDSEHRFAVIEMGAAAAGDIAYLCALARPSVSVLLNAMPAHLQGFGSVAEVARAKGEIFLGLTAQQTAVINADSEYAPLWREMSADADRIEFGISQGDVTARQLQLHETGSRFLFCTSDAEFACELNVPGRHNVLNALAAGAAALAAGCSCEHIARGLSQVQSVAGRLQQHSLVHDISLIDDSYNANPGSVAAAIDVLASMTGRRHLVLGAMAELGPDSAQLHSEVGSYARQQGIECCWFCGPETRACAESFGAGARHFSDRAALLESLQKNVEAGDSVLVKGSRSAGMDVLVADFVAALRDEAGGEN